MTVPQDVAASLDAREGPVHGLSVAAFHHAFVRLPDADGQLVVPSLHAAQARLYQAFDACDASGRRRFLTFLPHWSKKTRKTWSAKTFALARAVGDPCAQHLERLIGLAGWDLEQTDIVFRQICSTIDRHEFLRTRFRVLRHEAIYVEDRVEARTGGRYQLEHRILRLAHDSKGSQGLPFTSIVRDELHTEGDHSMSEALLITPHCPDGQVVCLSYHAPRAMERRGVPLHDLLERVRAQDPSVFYSYIGGRGPQAAWHVVPEISEAWVDEQLKLFAACPSRGRRILLNEPGGEDGGLIAPAELRDAVVPLDEPDRAEPGVAYFSTGDLGVSRDWSAVLVGHLDAHQRLVVDVIRTWRGTPEAPVSLMAVEDELVRLHQRFHLRGCRIDQWQSRQMVEQLCRRGVPATLVTIEGTKIDKLVTLLKRAFSQRVVAIPARAGDLIEQLESVTVIEAGSRGNRRRDLLKFQPGEFSGAGAHDDLCVCLGLLLEVVEPSLGRAVMAPMPTGCRLENFFGQPVDCILFDAAMGRYPRDPVCKHCEGFASTLGAHAAYQERTGEEMSVRTFLTRGLQRPNAFVTNRKFEHWAQTFLP